MKKLIIFTVFLSSLLFPQLKELEVNPTTQRGAIPVNRDNPDKAAIFFYTQFDDLQFWSNYGIVDIKGDPSGGKYIVIVEPVRQTIEVRRKGFKTEMIKIESLQPMDVLYYEVLPKKEEGVQGVTEVGVTVQVSPIDAKILIDGKPFPNNTTTKLTIGIHALHVEKAGHLTQKSEIRVTPDQTFFKVDLAKVQLADVKIRSTPTNASVFIDNEKKDNTELGLFLYPGFYDLRLELADYLPVNEKIEVLPGSENPKNIFSYTLIRNKGNLQLAVTPPDSRVSLNGNPSQPGNIELLPGKYALEVSASKYDTYREEIEIVRGKTVSRNISLVKNTGNLTLSVNPSNATIKINKEVRNGTSFEMSPGTYELEVSAPGYYKELQAIQIEKGKTLNRSVNLNQITGSLQFTIKPLEAKVTLSQSREEKYSWSGIKLIEKIPVGTYDLIAKANGYKSFVAKINITENQTTVQEIKMIAGSDVPDGMVWVEGGTFMMGSNEGEDDEKPIHQVTLNGFFIGKTEVTLESFSKFAHATGYETDAEKGNGSHTLDDSGWKKKSGVDWRCDTKGNKRPDSDKLHPVIHVSWNDAVAYCNWLSEREGLQKAYSGIGGNITCNINANGYRLPTEAEWEYAARGGNKSKGLRYSGSSNLDEVGWYGAYNNNGNRTKEEGTSLVGEKLPNELGIYDMSGNVWEWCWDWIGDNYYASSPSNNPKGPELGSNRVGRGGSWSFGAEDCRVTIRAYGPPDSSQAGIGFRLVRSK